MLQLEYICTAAEMREAQSLNTRQQLGKGSRARTYLVLFGILAILLAGAYLRFRTEVAPKDRPWFLALFVVVFIFFFFKQRFAGKRKHSGKPARIELSDREVKILNDGLEVSVPWSSFSQCLESANVFVLLDKPKRALLVFPKRVFPDESSQNWFRNQANQRPSVAESTADLPVLHNAPTPNGITLSYRLGYPDYLNRLSLSWGVKGILLFVYLFIIGQFFYTLGHPIPEAVNSPAKVLMIALSTITIMLAIMLMVVAFVSWRSHKKYLGSRQIVLSAERIDFAGQDGNGYLPWTTYKYWLENRWCFLIWRPGGNFWDMFPKRAFTSPIEIENCRVLLQQNLRRSRWFFN